MTPVDIGNAAQIISALGGVCSFAVAVWVATWQRSSIRRATDEAREAKTKALELANAARWHDTDAGKVVIGEVQANSRRLDIVEERLIHVATREDVARLSGEIATCSRATYQAVAGIDRIEGYFLAEGVRGRS